MLCFAEGSVCVGLVRSPSSPAQTGWSPAPVRKSPEPGDRCDPESPHMDDTHKSECSLRGAKRGDSVRLCSNIEPIKRLGTVRAPETVELSFTFHSFPRTSVKN